MNRSVNTLQFGLKLAQNLQRAIVRTGTSIIEERLVKTLKNFRLIVMKDGPDLDLFLHPLTLTKLALFMMDAMRETGRAYLPIVMAALKRDTDTYLVAGLDGLRGGGASRRKYANVSSLSFSRIFSDLLLVMVCSKFGNAFRKTADATRASIRQNRFDTAVIELARADLTRFMEYLQVCA